MKNLLNNGIFYIVAGIGIVIMVVLGIYFSHLKYQRAIQKNEELFSAVRQDNLVKNDEELSINEEKIEEKSMDSNELDLDQYIKKTFNEKIYTDMKTFDMLSNHIYKYFNALMEKDYETAYSLLSEEYIAEKNYTLEMFSEKMKEKDTEDYTYILKSYDETETEYLCQVEYFLSQYGEEKFPDDSTYYLILSLRKTEDGLKIFPMQ